MKHKKILTIMALTSTSGALVISSSIPLIVLNNDSKKSNDLPLLNKASSFDSFKQMFSDSSQKTGNQKYYRYDNQIFDSEEKLNEYIFNQNKIQAITTSSNPSKIIKDYEHEILDETKIFDTNINNFVQVFEKGTGNITLDRQSALQSFLSLGDVQREYSYDGIRWYDDEHKAQRAKNKDIKVNKSFYYLFDNNYYNAFNAKDIEILLSKMKEGYYLNLDKTLSGLAANKTEEVFGVKTNFAELLSTKFINDFYKNYNQKLIDFSGQNRLEISTNAKEGLLTLTINDKDFKYEGSSFVLEYIHDNFSSYYEMLNDFKDLTKWNREEVENKYYYNNGNQNVPYFVTHDVYTRKFDLNIDGYYKNDVLLKLEIPDRAPSYGALKVGRMFDFTKNLNYRDKTTGTIKYYLDPEKTQQWRRNGLSEDEMDNLYDPNLTNDQMSEFYNKWFDYYLNEVVLDFGVFNNQRVSWNAIKNQQYVQNKNEQFLAGNLYKDKMYEVNSGKGYTHSLIKSMKDWQKLKEELIYTTDNTNSGMFTPRSDEKRYMIVPDLLVSRDDLDNFLYLEGAGINSRVMYSVANEEHVSDLTGKWLAPTEQQAKALHQLYNEDSLRTRYLFYNNEGKLFATSYADDKNLAIDQLRNELQLNSRFVHKDDLKGFDEVNHPKKWSDLITTGKYTVYRIDNPLNDKGIWFKSEQQALDAIKSELKVSDNLEEIYQSYLVYNYLTEQGIILPIKYKESELDEVALELYELTYKAKVERRETNHEKTFNDFK